MPSERAVAGPAPRPCVSCPYRVDVPSGVWHEEEYLRLAAYDRPTPDQPAGVFLCHQTNREDPTARACAGWVGCHGQELLGLRIAAITGTMTDAAVESAMSYTSPVELFTTGAEAATHGLQDIAAPGPEAIMLQDKIAARRDLV